MTRYGCLLLAGFAGAVQSATYIDAVDFPTHAHAWNRFLELEERLVADFGNLCLDEFCKAGYGRIHPLRYRCSVDSETGVMGECVWVLVGSGQAIDPSSGAVALKAPVWHCRTPLAEGTRIEDFYQALYAWGGAIYARLPGTDRSIYKGLRDCLPGTPE